MDDELVGKIERGIERPGRSQRDIIHEKLTALEIGESVVLVGSAVPVYASQLGFRLRRKFSIKVVGPVGGEPRLRQRRVWRIY